MDKILEFLSGIWEFVMKILINSGVAVEDWVNPFDSLTK